MSLVNDMLRDLADQQQGDRSAPENPQQLLSDSAMGRQQKRMWLPSVSVFIVVLAVLLVFQYLNRSAMKNTFAELIAVNQPLSDVQPVMLPESAQANQNVDDAQENSPVVVNAIENTVHQQEISSSPLQSEIVVAESTQQNIQQQAVDAWLKLAAGALAQDKLTSPVEDSALYYFDQVATIAPGHPQVERGKEAIIQRYLQLTHEALAQQQTARAQTLLQRAKFVNPNHDGIEALTRQIGVAETDEYVAKTGEQKFGLNDDAHSGNSTPATAGEQPELPTSYSIPDSSVVAPIVTVTPNLAWQDQQMAEQARALMQQGKMQNAQLTLESFLQQQSPATLSSQLLCQLFIEQGDFTAAENLLADAERQQWPAIDSARLRAQWLMAQGDNAGALTLLEQQAKDAENDERYRALLASLYRTMAKYHESAAHYRRLITTFGETSSYWLGLALSLDALGQKSSAVEAFRRAQNFQPLQPEVNLYIEQRIAALAR